MTCRFYLPSGHLQSGMLLSHICIYLNNIYIFVKSVVYKLTRSFYRHHGKDRARVDKRGALIQHYLF